jgi:magnesium-transporting ATPase (P-type)
MFDTTTAIILTVFALALLVAPFVAGAYFQRRAGRYADEMLEDNAGEFNKQIRGNAVALLVRRSIWGLLFLWLAVPSFRDRLAGGSSWGFLIFSLLAVLCFTFAIFGYKRELKRLKPLK